MSQARIFDTPINSGDLSLDRVIAAGLPVAIVFLPKQSAATLEQKLNDLASRFAGELLIARVEASVNQASVRKYNVSGLPALVGVRNQQVITQANAISESQLEEHIAYLLGKGAKPAERASIGRFLGTLVWTLPHGRAIFRAYGERSGRQTARCQSQCR